MMSWSPSLSVSKFTATSIAYEWPIVGSTSLKCWNDEGVKSPIFPADSEEAVQWQLKLRLNDKTYPIGVTFWLYGSSKHTSSVKTSVAFQLLARNGESITSRKSEIKTLNFDPTKGTDWTEMDKWEFCEYKKYFIGTFAIHCTIDIYEAQKDVPDFTLFYKVPTCSLWQDFESLLSSGKNADVTLVTKTPDPQKVKAHKAILMARSRVFDAMFSNQLRENLDNSVVIDDLDFDVLDEMVRFIYTGKVSNLSNVADRLLMAADKYDLPILRVMCEQEMGIQLSVENAAQTLVLAELHHASQLKRHTLSFIKHHAKDVLATDGLQVIKASHPDLLYDMLQSLATL